MKIKIISLLTVSLLLFSCGNLIKEKSTEQAKIVKHEEQQHDIEVKNIELNNGEKWKIDENMILPIQNMEKDIKVFSITEQKDFKSLAEKLQNNIDVLTSSCTMKGKAHDELHKWLLPYIDLVTKLSEAKNETEASNHFENIQNSFKTFNQYFK